MCSLLTRAICAVVCIREGFTVSFNYNSSFICKQASGNMKLVKDDKEFIDKYIQEEGEAGRLPAIPEKQDD